MNVIETTAPISIEDLKKHFTDKSCVYFIDYKNSKLQGKTLLVYISNLDISCDLNLSGLSVKELSELFREYLHFEMICNIPVLEQIAIKTIQYKKQIENCSNMSIFVEGNEDILNTWISKLDSLTLYNMTITGSEEFKSYVESFPENDTTSVEGINFVSLLKHENFYSTYEKIDSDSLQNYTNYFNNYMFKGNNLYSYWANENNPLFLLTFAISQGVINTDEYVKAKTDSIQELKNASLI